MIILELPWPPSVNRYWIHRQRGTFISDQGLSYRKATLAAIRQAKVFTPLTGRVHVVVQLYPPDRRRRDIDNIFKCLFDSLEHGGALHNDNQIKKLEAEMHDTPEDAPLGIVEVYLKQIDSHETQTVSNNS